MAGWTSIRRRFAASATGCASAVITGIVLLIAGCGGGFFPPITNNPGGGGTTPPATTGNFIYVANQTTNTIAAFSIATSTAGVGSLTSISGSPYSFPTAPTAMVVTPANTFLYVAGLGGIYAYAINTSTGALTIANSGSIAAVTQLGSVSLDVSPDGKWLFALSQDNATLQEFQITASTGALAAAATVQYVGVSNGAVNARQVKVAPNGLYVFLTLGTGGDIVYPFTTATGVVNTTIGSFQNLPTGSTTTGDNAIAIDSNTAYAYIARSGASTGVAVFAIGTGGSLSSVAGSPFATGQGPFSVAIDSTGKYIYAANRTDGTISAFTIGTGGVLTAVAGSPFTSGISVTSLVRDNSGKYLLAAAVGGSFDLTMYSFDATTLGKLNSVATTTTGTDPTGAIQVVATH